MNPPPSSVPVRVSPWPSPDPEYAMQERTGPIFDLFMFLFLMAFIAFLGFKVIARKIVRAAHPHKSPASHLSPSSPPNDFATHGTE